jgi:D-aminopeptidase
MAWPAAVVVLALIFKVQIRQLTSRPLRRLKAGPLDMEFDRLGAEVEAAVGQGPMASMAREGAVQTPLIEGLEDRAASSPIAAVMDAHAAVEQAIRELILSVDPEANVSRMSMGQLLRLASDRDLVTPETAKAVEGITIMRNLAAHGRASEVTLDRARDYLALTDAVLYALRQKPTT